MLTKRIIPCLDVKDGNVVKGIHFLGLKEVGDPVALAKKYYLDGADELVFLDISATVEKRKTMVEVVKKVAKEIFIPFTVGGGIQTVDRLGKDLGAGGLARPPGAGKQVGMANAPGGDLVLQGRYDGFLANNIRKLARTPLAVQRTVQCNHPL